MASLETVFPHSSENRRYMARHLRGVGLEIGALQTPLYPLKHVEKVYYMDHFDTPTLREHYPELADLNLVNVNLIGDIHTLPFAECALDFVIINHVIEHVENFIGVLRRLSRILKPGGHLFVTVPDQRFTFDKYREITEFEHFVDELQHGVEHTRTEHYRQWVQHVQGSYFDRLDPTNESAVDKQVKELMAQNYSIHFHVWTAEHFVEHLFRIQHEGYVDLELVDFVTVGPVNDNEFIVMLQKHTEDTMPPPVEKIVMIPSSFDRFRWKLINTLAPKGTSRRRSYNSIKSRVRDLLQNGS